MSADDQKIQLIEEMVSVDKKRIVTGRVRVTTESSTAQAFAEVGLEGVRVEVTRERLDREISSVPEIRVEGETTIIPVIEEIAVVEKRLILVEAIRIRKVTSKEEIAVPVNLRKQTATVERIEE